LKAKVAMCCHLLLQYLTCYNANTTAVCLHCWCHVPNWSRPGLSEVSHCHFSSALAYSQQHLLSSCPSVPTRHVPVAGSPFVMLTLMSSWLC